jgi:hypothetical protein
MSPAAKTHRRRRSPRSTTSRCRVSARAAATSTCTGLPARSVPRSGPTTPGCTAPGISQSVGPWTCDGLLRLPAGDAPPAPIGGEPDLHQHPALDRSAQRRPLRGDGAAGGAGRENPGFLPPPALIAPEHAFRQAGNKLRKHDAAPRPRPDRLCAAAAPVGLQPGAAHNRGTSAPSGRLGRDCYSSPKRYTIASRPRFYVTLAAG